MRSKADLFFSLPKGWEEQVKDLFSEGHGDIQVHIALGVNALEHKALLDVEQYAEAFTNGMAICEAYWMNRAQEALKDREYEETFTNDEGKEVKRVYKPAKFDTKLYETMMKRMFSWDKRLDKKDSNEGEKSNKSKRDADKFLTKHGIRKIK